MAEGEAFELSVGVGRYNGLAPLLFGHSVISEPMRVKGNAAVKPTSVDRLRVSAAVRNSQQMAEGMT